MPWPAVGTDGGELAVKRGLGSGRDIELAEQPQQPVGGVRGAKPAVEVEARQDLLGVARAV